MPDILTTADVMLRYGCERHTAASIMHKLPVFRVGKKMFVKMRDLLNWEESRIEYPSVQIRTTTTTKIARRKD